MQDDILFASGKVRGRKRANSKKMRATGVIGDVGHTVVDVADTIGSLFGLGKTKDAADVKNRISRFLKTYPIKGVRSAVRKAGSRGPSVKRSSVKRRSSVRAGSRKTSRRRVGRPRKSSVRAGSRKTSKRRTSKRRSSVRGGSRKTSMRRRVGRPRKTSVRR